MSLSAAVPCAVVIALGLATAAMAEEERCPAIAGGSPTLAAAEPLERLLYLQRELDADARRVRIWAWTWSGIYTGLIVANAAVLARASSHGERVDEAFATGASAFGLVVLAVMPPAVLRDQPKLSRIVAGYAVANDRCASLAAAERLLLRDARSEAFGRGPLVHAGNFVFNAALGITLGAAFGRWQTGAIVAPIGIAVGELQLLTVRTHLSRTLAQYRSGALDHGGAPPRPVWTLAPRLAKDELGLSFGLRF